MRLVAALVALALVALVPPASAVDPSACSVGFPPAVILRAGCDFSCEEGQTLVAIGVGGVAYGFAGNGAGAVVAECGGLAAGCVAIANAGDEPCADSIGPTIGMGSGRCEGVGAGLERFACCALPPSEDPIAVCKALVGW